MANPCPRRYPLRACSNTPTFAVPATSKAITNYCNNQPASRKEAHVYATYVRKVVRHEIDRNGRCPAPADQRFCLQPIELRGTLQFVSRSALDLEGEPGPGTPLAQCQTAQRCLLGGHRLAPPTRPGSCPGAQPDHLRLGPPAPPSPDHR